MSEYQVILSTDGVGAFQWQVNQEMRQGWKPIGGVSVVVMTPSRELRMYQAMERQLPEASES